MPGQKRRRFDIKQANKQREKRRKNTAKSGLAPAWKKILTAIEDRLKRQKRG